MGSYRVGHAPDLSGHTPRWSRPLLPEAAPSRVNLGYERQAGGFGVFDVRKNFDEITELLDRAL
jgi:hypothetical protein